MPRKLILIRHAKSDWSDPDATDHERVLNARGRASATAIGAWLRKEGHVPGEILSSDSARTQETVARILPELGAEPVVQMHRALYLADQATLMAALTRAEAETVALVAHNPGIGEFAQRIVGAAPDHPRFHDYPTAATLVAECDIDIWTDMRPGLARVLDFVTPRELV